MSGWTARELEEHRRLHDCPLCGARRGERCVKVKGEGAGFEPVDVFSHAARIRLADPHLPGASSEGSRDG